MKDKTVSFTVYETTITKMERTQKRVLIAILAFAGLLVGSNLAWVTVHTCAIVQQQAEASRL